MEKNDRIMEITDRYLERFGKALIGIYYLPPLVENWKFMVFINSLLITLRRMDLMPHYTWFMDAAGGHCLILWLNGYFRNDLSDVTQRLNQLWLLHSSMPITELDTIPLSVESQAIGIAKLRQFLYSHCLSQTIASDWHQRTFGTSRLR